MNLQYCLEDFRELVIQIPRSVYYVMNCNNLSIEMWEELNALIMEKCSTFLQWSLYIRAKDTLEP